jgi:hypothetical protein
LLDIDTKYYKATHDVLSSEFVPSARRINGMPYLPQAASGTRPSAATQNIDIGGALIVSNLHQKTFINSK